APLAVKFSELAVVVETPPDPVATMTDGATLPSKMDAPLWSMIVDPDSEVDMSSMAGAQARGAEMARRPLRPAVGAAEVFVNDGHTVHAIDRIAGRLLWVYRPNEIDSAA